MPGNYLQTEILILKILKHFIQDEISEVKYMDYGGGM